MDELARGVWPWADADASLPAVLSEQLGSQYLSGFLIGCGVGGVVGAFPVALPLSITLNGQQYTANAPDSFVVSGAPPLPLGARPATGPERGGTDVVVSGLRLAHGTRYLCAFGATRCAARSTRAASRCPTSSAGARATTTCRAPRPSPPRPQAPTMKIEEI